MVIRFEERRGRIILHFLNKWRLEWTVEPRYWRNPLIATVLWICIPPLIIFIPREIVGIGPMTLLSSFIMANIIAISAIAHAFQTIGTGRVSFGPHFFVVVGGYVAALLNKNYGVDPVITLLASFAVAALVGLGLSPLTIISRGIYFTLITLILPLILYEFTYWRSDIFGAETGIPGVTRLVATGNAIVDLYIVFYISLAIVVILLLIIDKILRSRWGLVLGVINEDEDVAASFGIDTRKIKVIVFSITCGIMGISGWLIAHYYGSFAGTMWLEPWMLIFILLSSTLGGKGAIYGTVIGAYFIILLRDLWRVYLSGFHLGEYALLALYTAMLASLYLMPEGLWGVYRKRRYREYVPSIRIRRKL
ncbi:MAG: branched-chain amino acid ABC transporter permease [Candidatus Nezhaarchaeota archaeon]|nr:branched-chain amino acid ABC transporter permease [Candidatus Nezhaarchaeota archaeon]